jgi:teichuronic acid biosynthesis glycosyltransferase TuaC
MNCIPDIPCSDEISSGVPKPCYTLGLFANMYPAFNGDYHGIFIQQMVKDLESLGVTVKKAVKTSPSLTGYASFSYQSLILARDPSLDLIQAEYIPHSSLIPAYFRSQNIPLVLKFHGDDARIFPFKNRFNLDLTRSMLKRAAHVITASEEMRQILIAIGADSSQVTAIHTGVDTDFFTSLSKENCRQELKIRFDDTIFLFAGRLHPTKGIGELIQVAHRCPHLTFVFVGPGKIPEHPRNCIFTGVKNHNDVRTWLNAADCLILPTYTEAVPTSVMEAFACGIPAITTDVGGCPEIVEQGKNGLMVPVRDIDALQSAVMWMNTHPDERKIMGYHGRLTVRERFDHKKLIERLISIHQGLINK